MYHLIANYPEGTDLSGEDKYVKTETWVDLTMNDEIITWDFMKEIFKNWCYVNEAVAHCDANNYRAVLDKTST